MRADFGAPYNSDDVGNPELLRQVTGIAPEAGGMHVLAERAGFMSVQRLGILKVSGGTRVALSPGEFQSHARYLYSDRRVMLARARH